jgi:serine/threonine protein phosphatase PrpC
VNHIPCMSYALSARTIQDRSKERNGDAFAHTVLDDGSFLLAMVADGVGSCPCDWLASQTACEQFVTMAKDSPTLADDPAGWLKRTLEQIDDLIHSATGRGRGMKCAATALIWKIETEMAWFANIGDTRLYQFIAPRFAQVSEDDCQAVIRRGQDGKPLFSGGAAVIQRGITNAIGSGNASVVVRPCSFPSGAAFVLTSDGFYGCTPETEDDLVGVLAHGDLDDAVSLLAATYQERNQDDATVLVLRRTFPALNDVQFAEALTAAGNADIPRHAIASAIAERLPSMIADRAEAPLKACLEYLDRNNLLLGKSRTEVLLRQMKDANWTDRFSFNTLVSMIRQYS